MNCKDAHTLIQDYVDGELHWRDKRVLARHLVACRGCAEALRYYDALASELSQLPLVAAPAGLAEGVIAKLRGAGRIADRSPAARRVRRWGAFAWLPARLRVPVAAAVAFVVVAAVVPITSELFHTVVGKGTVMVADTYLDVSEGLDSVEAAGGFVDGLERNLRTLGTVLRAAFSLLVQLGEHLALPAVGMLATLILGAAWLLRHRQRRSSGHAAISV